MNLYRAILLLLVEEPESSLENHRHQLSYLRLNAGTGTTSPRGARCPSLAIESSLGTVVGSKMGTGHGGSRSDPSQDEAGIIRREMLCFLLDRHLRSQKLLERRTT